MASLSPVVSDQWGMLTAAHARRLGVSRVDLNRLVEDGTFEPVSGAARVYRLTGVPDDPDQARPVFRHDFDHGVEQPTLRFIATVGL